MLLAAIINPIADVEVVNNWDLEAQLYKLVSRRCPQLVCFISRAPEDHPRTKSGSKTSKEDNLWVAAKLYPCESMEIQTRLKKIKRKPRNIGLDTRTKCQCQGRSCCYGNVERNNKQTGNGKSCLSSPSLLGSSVSFAVRVYQMCSKWEVRLQNPSSEVRRVCRNRDTSTQHRTHYTSKILA